MEITVKIPQRLDRLASELLISRGAMQRLIKRGAVTVNGKTITTPHVTVRPGNKVFVHLSGPPKQKKNETSLHTFEKLFEDDSLLVIDKPPFIRVENIIPVQKRGSLFLAHRLDKDTSGVLVIAKGEKSLLTLQKEWKLRKVKKKYIVLLQGILTPCRGSIEAPIARSIKLRTKMAVSAHPSAREASTAYKVTDYFEKDSATLVEAYPFTGRTHQIRVHFAAIGHPVIGDNTYGSSTLNKKFEQSYGLKRQFLHAAELSLTHPQTKKRLTLRSKLPKDLAKIVQELK